MNPLLSDYSFMQNISPLILAIVLIWSLIWKGLALWKSAQKKSKPWFIALLIINTIGIFEILYIYVFSEIKLDDKNKIGKKQKRNKVEGKKSKSKNHKTLP